MKRLWTQAWALAWIAGGCAVAQAQSDAALPEASREAKTIQLLLQLQGSASAPAPRAAGGELPPLRSATKQGAAPAPEANPFEMRPEAVEAAARNVHETESRAHQVDLPADRPVRSSSRTMEDTMDKAPDISRLMPVQLMRFVRENREIVIALSLGLLVLLAVAGAAAGSGAKRR